MRSFEDFALGERVMGIIGGTTDVARRGVGLLHGPFIDPLYPSGEANTGPLWLTLVNHSRSAVSFELGDRIGKITFYEVSDTYPVVLDPKSVAARAFRDRSGQ